MTRRSKSKASKSPLVRLVGLEAAVAVSGVAGCLTAVAAPGDLDPSFGDVGRQSGIESPPYFSSLWSVDVQGDESVLFGGGGEYDYYYTAEDNFLGRLLPDGTPDAGFAAATLQYAVVYDTALQSDGKLIGVGVAKQPDGRKKLLVFRLRPDGALDPDFGLGGLVVVSDGTSSRESGDSVIIDTAGRIVVAGSRNSSLLVARLLANGTLDAGFGTGGTYSGARTGAGPGSRVALAPGGGYRITAHIDSGSGTSCVVVGLTGAGVLDGAFGIGGSADPRSPGVGILSCSSLVVQGDGRILVGGMEDYADGYVGRLLATGAVDPDFIAGVVPGRFKSVTAMAVGAGGSIFAAGPDRMGLAGALVVRLLANGTLDTVFGRDGAATVDLQTRRAKVLSINDMKVLAGDRLVVGGGYGSYWSEGGAFVARLLGNTGGGGPGVLSLKQERVLGTEQDGKAVLVVRRSGGSEGAVAVNYSTRDFPVPPENGPNYAPGERAAGGADYTVTNGRLTWADGDTSEREIEVPIASDATGEQPEWFEVVLESPEGGAGLGALGADVEIAGASYPVGELTIQAYTDSVKEGGDAWISVNRNFYGEGAVSVTLRVAADGSATAGQDYSNAGSIGWQDVVLTWSDGETGSKSVQVRIANDGTAEQLESFTLELVSPTGGALLGGVTQATVQIWDAPQPPSMPAASSNGGSGGGSLGWFGTLLFGLGGALRRRRIRNH